MAIGACGRGLRVGPAVDLGSYEWGWQNGFNRAGWDQAVEEFRNDPDMLATPALKRHVAAVINNVPVGCQSRTELVGDREWYVSINYQLMQRVCGLDHTAWCLLPMPQMPPGCYHNLILARATGRADFSARENALVAEIHSVVAGMIGGPLAGPLDPSPTDLPLRTRQVPRCLFEGDSDKQIAMRLGIAAFTVNQHVKRILAHFRVNSRSELLARWPRRGWTSRCAWADGNLDGSIR